MQSKTAVKTLSVFMLLAILSALLLTGCGKPGNGPDGTGAKTAPAAPGTDMRADAGRRYVKTEAGSANDLVANGLYANCYSDAPDIPPAGSVCFTPLAAYIANNAADDEEIYFIVGITDGPDGNAAVAGYLKAFGIELCRSTSDAEWRARLAKIKHNVPRIERINGRMDILVKCSRDALLKLIDGNDKYGFIFYASEPDGRYVYSNDCADAPSAGSADSPERIVTDECVVYSYRDIGMYGDLIFKKK